METKQVLDNQHRENPSSKPVLMDTTSVVDTLNRILEMELAGAILYTHCAFMVCGHDRMQFTKWFEGQASEGMTHAKTAGELVTQFGAHPSLGIAALTECRQHDTNSILRELLAFEKATLAHYVNLLELVQHKSVVMEEYARQHIYLETQHIGEIDKMLRKPGELKNYEAA